MGNIGWSGIIIVAVIVVLLFGRGKISSLMGDGYIFEKLFIYYNY